jgi:hypothetical protein
LPGHPEAMKKSYRRDYFHTSAWKGNSAKFAFWGFSEVKLSLYGVLRRSPHARNAQATAKIVHLGDTLAALGAYAPYVTTNSRWVGA